MAKQRAAHSGPEKRLEIRLFGQAAISWAGTPVKFAKRSTTLAMLAFLVLKRGQAVSRESLAFVLFPESDEAAALAELRRYLYLAGKSLPAIAGDAWLHVDAETVRWNAAAGAVVDVLEFERLSAASSTQSQAVALYAGDLLEDVYDDWVLAERERLRARYLGVLEELLERHRSNREFGDAIACAKRILVADPWREDTLRSLLALRYESGDNAGALAEYDRFAKRLRDELAIAPMPETVAVRQSILRSEAVPGSLPSPRPPADETPRRRLSILPFVGRDREQAGLYAAWGRAARGGGGLIVLSGEAGAGKTRLAAELARRVQTEGGRVFAGTTAAPESAPYQAIVEALRSGLPLLLARPPGVDRRATLAKLLPELGDSDAGSVLIAAQSSERETARTFDALAHAVRGLASPRPLLLILEDLHWAGFATIDALGAIVRALLRAPVLVVATCRDEETPFDHPLRALQRSLQVFHNVEEIELPRLSEDDVGELVHRVEGLRVLGGELQRDLYAQSEGNALFLDEAISVTLDERAASSAPPATVTDVIAARIERLSDEARTVAAIAAVAGAGCSAALLRDVSSLTASAIARGLDELLDRRILREAGARASHDYVFGHHLIAEAMYAAIEPSFRAQRHARIARRLETIFRESERASPREIALHYERSGDVARSAQWYLTAARRAAAVHAYGDAIELADGALQNAGDDALRIAALDVRERAHGQRGDRAGQRADIDALERLAAGPSERFDVVDRRVALARSLGDTDDEAQLIAQLQALAEGLDDNARAQALTQAATHAKLRSRAAQGLGPAQAALAIYERSNDVRGQMNCLCLLVELSSNLGDLDASQRYLAVMRERAESLADRAVEAHALAIAAVEALLRQKYAECFALTQRSLELHVAINDREGEAASRGRLAVTALWLTDYTLALREFDLALATYESIGHKRGLAVTHTNRTTLLMRLGMFEEALHSIERSNALFDAVQEKRTFAANQVNASFVKLQLGDAEAAKSLAASALTAARDIGFPVFEAAALANLGNAERSLGQLDLAIEHMEAGIAIRRPLQDVRDFVDDLADATLAYADAGRNDQALATARELSSVGTVAFENAFWPHYVWWAAATGLAAGGAREDAREAAARARSELQRFAGGIADESTRRTFLDIPLNRRIAESA